MKENKLMRKLKRLLIEEFDSVSNMKRKSIESFESDLHYKNGLRFALDRIEELENEVE